MQNKCAQDHFTSNPFVPNKIKSGSFALSLLFDRLFGSLTAQFFKISAKNRTL